EKEETIVPGVLNFTRISLINFLLHTCKFSCLLTYCMVANALDRLKLGSSSWIDLEVVPIQQLSWQ
ncbi:hypothetical protein, partial [Chroococcidiopsis sp [FACHB-1243]]|uniref:hypothetical protein n=1 Tax=Chroococcidiopsis sp. [FACHB-1243] TaxID=2692781 RepID=UPI001A7EC4F3